jgi:hypothetical protein
MCSTQEPKSWQRFSTVLLYLNQVEANNLSQVGV